MSIDVGLVALIIAVTALASTYEARGFPLWKRSLLSAFVFSLALIGAYFIGEMR